MNKIQNYISQKAEKNFLFVPDDSFYKAVNIKRRRWGQIYRGEKSPTIEEIKRIASFFEINISELIEL